MLYATNVSINKTVIGKDGVRFYLINGIILLIPFLKMSIYIFGGD